MISFVVPKTFMALPSAETNSIILFVSGRISTFFFLTHFSSTELCLQQYLITHVVMQVHYHYLFIFTFRLIIGMGKPVMSTAFTAGLETESSRLLTLLPYLPH